MMVVLCLGINTAWAQEETIDYSYLGSFDEIEASLGWDIIFTQSSKSSIKVTVTEHFRDHIEVNVKDGTLILGLRKIENHTEGNHINIKAEISAPSLKSIDITTGACIAFSNMLRTEHPFKIKATTGAEVSDLCVTTPHFECGVYTGATLDGEVYADSSGITCATGSEVELKGKSTTANLTCKTGAEIDAKELKCKVVKATATVGAQITTYASETVEAKTSVGGEIDVYGNPKPIKRKGGVRFR